MKVVNRFGKLGSFFLLWTLLVVLAGLAPWGCATSGGMGAGAGAAGGESRQTMVRDSRDRVIPWAKSRVPDDFIPEELAGVPLETIPRFVFLDVGQGDSTLVFFNGLTMLVDAGSSLTTSERYRYKNIVKALRKFTGKLHVDYVVISHYHADHLGQHLTYSSGKTVNTGLYGLIEEERVTVGTIIDRGSEIYGMDKPNPQVTYERMILRWLSDGVVQKRRSVNKGDTIDMGPGMQIDVIVANSNGLLQSRMLSEPDLMREWPPSENDYSIGLKFTVGDFEMFTAGDLSGVDVRKAYGENKMSYNDVETLIAHDITEIELYRVNHHGSGNSTNPCFISVLNPEVSISSTGVNRYGHPDVRVMELLLDVGEVLITGGVDREVKPLYSEFVVGANIGVQVHPTGEKYWVHGREFRSLSEEEELARPDYGAACEGFVGNVGGPAGSDTDAEGDDDGGAHNGRDAQEINGYPGDGGHVDDGGAQVDGYSFYTSGGAAPWWSRPVGGALFSTAFLLG